MEVEPLEYVGTSDVSVLGRNNHTHGLPYKVTVKL